MKLRNLIKYAVCVLLAGVAFASCVERELDIVDQMNLTRCLEPMNLEAKVNSTLGDVVTFSWDVAKDAEYYELTVYTDEARTKKDFSERVEPANVPIVKKLTADKTYWFTVQAFNEKKEPSHVAVAEKSFKTYAVKDNLFMKVTDRQATSVSLAWSKDVSDYKEVTWIEYGMTGGDGSAKHELTSAEIDAAAAVIDGLAPSMEYTFTLYYLSASRGQVDAWTTPDVTGFTEVSTLDALKNAMATQGAKIRLMQAGSPYDIGTLDISAGFSLVGEETADGAKPVLAGELQIADTWAGTDLYFEGVEFNGAPTAAAPSGFGFAIQNKNGGTVADKNIGNLTYRNCVITNYSKGIIYEWGKAMVLGEVTYDSCEISKINADGSGGGDVFDIRQATTIGSLSFVGNTITQGMRTFLRIDAGTIGALVIENNTIRNLNFVDNTNNAGIFGLQIVPGSVSFKNNLFLHMVEKAVLGSANAKYKTADDVSVSAFNNWFYDVVETYFTDSWPAAKAGANMLSADPCFNSAGGYFNINPDSEIAGKAVGAPKWWTPYVEEPEDLTQGVITGAHVWDLGNARNWSGTIKKQMVRDGLLVAASEANPIVAADGMLAFAGATVTDRKQVPADGYIAFKVAAPGSVVARAAGEGTGHLIIATQPLAGGDLIVKGGVSPVADAPAAQKVVISDISEPSWVYVYASGEVALAELAWSTDVSAVNTALPAPAPVATPSSFTAGEATDVVVSWEAVDNAGSYSVVFNGKTYAADGLQYVIEAKTTSMLDAGSYTVAVYANPAASDIYNTQSEAGVAAFAVLPKGGSEESGELVVKDIDGLLSAIGAGKEAITLSDGEYDLGGLLTVTAPLALQGSRKAVVKGAFKLSGAVGNFSIKGITVDAASQGVFIDLDSTEGVTAESISVSSTVIRGFSKSVIYASNAADKFQIDNITFSSVEVYDHGTGQGMFDLRNGKYQQFSIANSTLTGGRDFLRIDATCSLNSVIVKNNTMYNLNTSKNGNGIFYVRATPSIYRVERNLLLGMTSGTTIGKAGASVPVMSRNYYYDCNDDVFFTGLMDKETALGGEGVILSVNPVKDAANNDFTVTNGVVMAAQVGAPKWNPASTIVTTGGFRVTNADEFQAAIDAGKNNIIFAPGEYDLSAAVITLGAGMVLTGEPGAAIKVNQFNLAEGELGNIVIENLTITAGSNNFIEVNAASVVKRLQVRNCVINNVGKSVFYGNGEGSSFSTLYFSNNVFSGLGGGQGTIDIRKGEYTYVSVSGNTVVGGRDFIRADAGKVISAISITNNTFDGVTLNNGNGVLYVRSTPESYVVKNNLFLNENGANNLLAKSGCTVPGEVARNFFYNCTAEKFWSGAITQEAALAGGGVILADDPVKDSANGDYTLTSALCIASEVGAPRWNPNAGSVSSEITVNNVTELATVLDAGKRGITLKAGTYDLRELAESGVINLTAPVYLTGNGHVEIIGGFKLGVGVTDFVVSGISFNGAEKALGNTFEIAEATQLERILIANCDFNAYNKSLFYGNGADSKVGSFDFRKNLVHGFGTGQGMIDIRKGVYDVIDISENSFYDGGRDFARVDKEIAGSIAITNNTFAACSVDAGNGLLWIRSLADATSRYVVKKNLFLNIGNNSLLAKTGATVPAMSDNWFYNVGEKFFTGAISQDAAVANGGGILTEDPCAGSAEFKLKLVNPTLKSADIGDPRWNSSSARYIKKK
ncbi:MAG: DUF4957 domain-containing protein [Bacteroidales bacterium]|nr:DUF4957 domain-containing protein [Bacteroidales bacterium]